MSDQDVVVDQTYIINVKERNTDLRDKGPEP